MVIRTDGEPIGVQIDERRDDRLSQFTLALLAVNAFKFDAPPDGLQGVELSVCQITVGIMPEGAAHDDKDNWVLVVAVAAKHPNQKVYFVATQRCFGEYNDDNESSNLPRLVTFDELEDQGELLGRFEKCTISDIVWYTNYMKDHDGTRPATGCAFPSAETHGPFGDKGGYNNEGKAIKIRMVDQMRVRVARMEGNQFR